MKTLFALFLLPLTYILNGFVLSKLWGWFIVTTFALPQLAIAQAIGLGMVVGFLTMKANTYKDDPEKDAMYQLQISVVGALITLLVGYIVSFFM